jgi:hypothetical protein
LILLQKASGRELRTLKKHFKIVPLSLTVQASGLAGFITKGDTVRRTKNTHAKGHNYK